VVDDKSCGGADCGCRSCEMVDNFSFLVALPPPVWIPLASRSGLVKE